MLNELGNMLDDEEQLAILAENAAFGKFLLKL
jgi:hypothetical protein